MSGIFICYCSSSSQEIIFVVIVRDMRHLHLAYDSCVFFAIVISFLLFVYYFLSINALFRMGEFHRCLSAKSHKWADLEGGDFASLFYYLLVNYFLFKICVSSKILFQRRCQQSIAGNMEMTKVVNCALTLSSFIIYLVNAKLSVFPFYCSVFCFSLYVLLLFKPKYYIICTFYRMQIISQRTVKLEENTREAIGFYLQLYSVKHRTARNVDRFYLQITANALGAIQDCQINYQNRTRWAIGFRKIKILKHN
uniref:G protein-coupled receptor n=1 Tax=Heterorhabditis bacteriophora TaxID=37862 RepID=A0A1I7W9J6_HETBA